MTRVRISDVTVLATLHDSARNKSVASEWQLMKAESIQ